MTTTPQPPSCPVCDAGLTFSPDACISEIITCPECSADLEIITLQPPSLAEAPLEEEDWGE